MYYNEIKREHSTTLGAASIALYRILFKNIANNQKEAVVLLADLIKQSHNAVNLIELLMKSDFNV